LEQPDDGSVQLDGEELTGLREQELFPFRRRIGMLFQSGALFDSMNVLENIAFPLREHTSLGKDEIAEGVREKLAMVQLPGIEERMPSDLSGGMRKRVALARSLALEPELMLYDEPTTGLDPVTSAAIGQLIQHTQRELGVSSVIVTHDLPLARTVSRRLAFLFEGRFRFYGTWAEADASDDPVLTGFLSGRAEMDDAA
ncbi:MAG: ATP-binding cassette domain-containing protein, partial [Acidobacteriota bacterium]